jgi:hypothetical protein
MWRDKLNILYFFTNQKFLYIFALGHNSVLKYTPYCVPRGCGNIPAIGMPVGQIVPLLTNPGGLQYFAWRRGRIVHIE